MPSPPRLGPPLLAAALAVAGLAVVTGQAPIDTVEWRFDRLDLIDGHRPTVLGDPRVVDTPLGKVVAFDGEDDALVVDAHPLSGATAFTWEAVFRPDGGSREQRWLHLQENGTENRLLFEIRVVEDQWFLDSYVFTPAGEATLMNRKSLHPLGRWYHVASVYDGTVFRNYIDGVEDGAKAVTLTPPGEGQAAVGMRLNRVYYFRGAIHSTRFTRRALPPSEFVQVADIEKAAGR